MKCLQFDSVGGASGDLILGSLIELGVDAAWLQKELEGLGLHDEFKIVAEPFGSHGLNGTKVTVQINEAHHHHHDERHHGRSLVDIEKIISTSRLDDRVKKMSFSVFRKIGEAEAKIHRVPIDKIHFHEIGAVDSIVDIVGCCLGLHKLGVENVAVGLLPMGRGTIQCAHGVYPNPAPATVELLQGMAIYQTEEPFELVTPTGAALLSTWKTSESVPTGSHVVKTGYSFGHHRLQSRPNVLRAVLLEAGASNESSECLVLETNIDDCSPELLGALVERLLQAGALDVFYTPVQMKKQRPGSLLTVLCASSLRDALLDLIFKETTTFGVREYMTQRTMLERRVVSVQTPYGAVRIKVGRWKGQDVTFAPEMDDCIKLSREKNVPVRTIYDAAQKANH